MPQGPLVACGGVLVFLADYPAELPWLQWIAFVPLLVGCLQAGSWRRAALLGGTWGLARFLPLGIMLGGLGVPPLPAVVLSLYLVSLDAVFAVSVHAMRRWPAVGLAVGAGAIFAVLERLDALLPMWGTSKSLARSWAIAPDVMGGLVRLGGPPLVGMVIVAAQVLVVVAILERKRWVLGLVLPLVAMIPATQMLYPSPSPSTSTTGRLRVGAVAWPRRDDRSEAERLVADAAGDGARLVVMPEGAFEVLAGRRPEFTARWGEVARRHGIYLVVGFIDREQPGNRLAVFDPTGVEIGRYTKTHIIPVTETHPPGDGTLLVFEVDGVRVGTLICQDDNFRDLTAAYVRAGVDLVVVPTFEGPREVAPYHYRNARLRAIEFPVGLVRAAARGTSAIVAPGGAVVAAVEHPIHGAAAVVADVPL